MRKAHTTESAAREVSKPAEQWRQELTPMQYERAARGPHRAAVHR